ncbi:MAG: hypothetical protein GEU81_04895 [Nitriliruptorales bacterium]|nr:hypothetical protein [Nitriliruptorales bacterium]
MSGRDSSQADSAADRSILRFGHLVVRPNLARLEQREAVAVWRDSLEGFAAQALGPHFEGLARTWMERFASEETLGGAGSGCRDDHGQ